MNDLRRPGAELQARISHACAVLGDFEAERDQVDHLVDWLSQAVRLSSALSGVLDQLEAADDTGAVSHPGSGVAQPGGGWLSGPMRSP